MADVLHQLGAELRDAADRGEGTIAFMAADVEMDVAVENTGAGGVKFWVLNAGASHARTTTTRIKVSVQPHSNFQQEYGVGK